MIRTQAQERFIAGNRLEYTAGYEQLHFLTDTEASRARHRRDELLSALAGQALVGCGGTKLDHNNLAPGCQRCVAGKWSCLFINGRCNARCFYCPTSQGETGLPATNTLEFRLPADYVGYLEAFGFTGASISGGEPLLTPQRSLAFISAIKRHFGANMHVWLYTNGLLFDDAMAARLRDAGLDEIRFDIGATGYRLDALRKAVGVIPTVTVEIPAVPEEGERLRDMLSELRTVGVDHLNLHQLRLTPYNFAELAKRNYTFVHGEKVTVLESELTALELLQFSHDQKIGLPINYCSFVYKNRYQAAAARERNAQFLVKPVETLTDSGYLRTLTLQGSLADIARQAEQFQSFGAASGSWSYGSSREQLVFAPQLLSLVDFAPFTLQVAYAACRQMTSVSYRNPFVAVRVSDRMKVVVEKARQAVFDLSGAQITDFIEVVLRVGDEKTLSGELAEMAPYEKLPAGLQDYY
jgi:pyruvate formate-lyase activating enzyme-like uncharacterized protein